MSALAMILAKNGYSISGSDQKISSILRELAGNNINIFQTQEESNIDEILKVYGKNILVVTIGFSFQIIDFFLLGFAQSSLIGIITLYILPLLCLFSVLVFYRENFEFLSKA